MLEPASSTTQEVHFEAESIPLRRLRTHSSRASSIDADDFVLPDELIDTEEHYVPDNRPPTPERLARRRERKRAYSLAGQGASNQHKLRKAFRRFKTLGGSTTTGASSSTSSTSSKHSSASHLSKMSSVSWPRWKFWRDSSSSGSSHSGSDQDSDVDSYIPPDPVYTCLIPNLNAMPATLHHDAANVFGMTESRNLQDALDVLAKFWYTREQTEGAGGDLSAPFSTLQEAKTGLTRTKSNSAVPRNVTAQRRTAYEGSSWWLDIMCPSIQDMRLLRKIFPLHPLTIEDILHQDPREKFDTFEAALGYQFIVFRAIDESYFRYTDSLPDEKDFHIKFEEKSNPNNGNEKSHARGKLTIVEGLGGKEGVEGSGVGAVNMYLVVYDDGILSFHFEPLDKHIQAVVSKIQRIGALRKIKSQWIAYGLMDSVVDSFFPLIGAMEDELKLIDDFLADPISVITKDAFHIHAESYKLQKAQTSRLAIFGKYPIAIPHWLLSPRFMIVFLSEFSWYKSQDVLKGRGGRVNTGKLTKPKNIGKAISASMATNTTYQPKVLLSRIAQSRKLVTAMAKLLLAKSDVVRGMRKRNHALGEISLYLGDLEDHIYNLRQSLNFFEVMLNHDHPVLIGLLRLANDAVKNHNDRLLYRIYIVTLLFLACTAVTGAFSLNVHVPHNGSRYDDNVELGTEPDGSIAPKILFGVVIILTSVAMCIITGYIKMSWKSVLKHRNRSQHV